MNTNLPSFRQWLAFAALNLMTCLGTSAAPFPTAFTYQGRLTEQGQPANGLYDFRFVIRDAPVDGKPLRGAETKLGIPVRDGVFTVPIDFGSSVFDGELRWLDIGARTNGGSTFTSLTPLQPIRPTPVAITANALNGTVTASQVTGSLGSAALAGSYENPISFNSPSNRFIGDGSALRFGGFSYTNLPFYWNVKGNAGTTPGLQFLGTLDNQPLELRVNNQRVLRLEPTPVSPNIIAGFGGNYVDAGVIGSTISGGGTVEAPNRIIKDPNRTEPLPPEFGVIGGGSGNTISGASYVTIGGGSNNYVALINWSSPTAPQFHSVIAGGANNALVSAFSSTISGGTFNSMTGDPGQLPIGGTIGGGYGNSVSTITDNVHQPTIAGGAGNRIVQASFASIGGGWQNLIHNDSKQATIGGGGENSIGGVAENATISGGFSNEVEHHADRSTVGGGAQNLIQHHARYASIGGGLANGIGEEANGAVISGGESNQANGPYGTIGGGVGNVLPANTSNATISGGGGNEISYGSDHATIGGGSSNFMRFISRGAVIGGGEHNYMDVHCTHAVIAGGGSNFMGYYTWGSTISGGIMNRVGYDAPYATIGGGAGNNAGSRQSYGVTVGGGLGNAIGSYSTAATVGGGQSNVVSNLSEGSTIAGGKANLISLGVVSGTIGGGSANTIHGPDQPSDSARSFGGTIAGGSGNTVGTNTTGATIAGGESNQANGSYSTVAGGRLNVAGGTNSFAAGYRAHATNDGSFVWADSEDADFASTGTNQFLIRASGGVGIGTESPQFALHVNGDAGKPGGGAWSVASDARLKKDVRPLEQALSRLLKLHGVTYEYKDPKAIHELSGQQTGMIAQEVEKVFPEWVETAQDGMRRLSIRGFEALTVEALRELRAEKEAELRARDNRIADLERRLEALELARR